MQNRFLRQLDIIDLREINSRDLRFCINIYY